MGGTHTTTREEALQLVQTTFLEFGDILENLNRTVMRHGVENMQPDAVQLAQQVLDYSTNCYDPNLYTNGYAKLSNDGVSELLELCRKLSRLYKLPVSSHIPDGSLAITFELIPWFITSMQQMALARLDDNVNELQQVRERLLSEATQYIEGDGSSLDAIIRANEDLEAIDYRIIENADRMVMLMGCADYEGHERVRQENKALVAQKQAITARTPLVGFIGHRGRRSINALTRDIQRACGKVASAQVKVRAKIVSGDFPVWQMTPVVMDVLSTPGLTPRDIQEITGWIERQQKWETIKDVLSFAIPVAAAITCFFVPGGASILLLAVRAGAQAVNAVVGIASGIEDFDEANTHRNMVYSQLIMPTENLVEGSVGEADMRYFLGFVSLIAGGIDALDAVQAARVVSRFKSLPLDIQKQMSRMGRQGVKLLENLSTNQLTAVSSMANAEAVFDASTRYLTQTGFDNLKKLPDYQITQALDYFPNDPKKNMIWIEMINEPAKVIDPAIIKNVETRFLGTQSQWSQALADKPSAGTIFETLLNRTDVPFTPEELVVIAKLRSEGSLPLEMAARVQGGAYPTFARDSSIKTLFVTDPVELLGIRDMEVLMKRLGFDSRGIQKNKAILEAGGNIYLDVVVPRKPGLIQRISWDDLKTKFLKYYNTEIAGNSESLDDFIDKFPEMITGNKLDPAKLEDNFFRLYRERIPTKETIDSLSNTQKKFYNEYLQAKFGTNPSYTGLEFTASSSDRIMGNSEWVIVNSGDNIPFVGNNDFDIYRYSIDINGTYTLVK